LLAAREVEKRGAMKKGCGFQPTRAKEANQHQLRPPDAQTSSQHIESYDWHSM
jgi:hypothetical protein